VEPFSFYVLPAFLSAPAWVY